MAAVRGEMRAWSPEPGCKQYPLLCQGHTTAVGVGTVLLAPKGSRAGMAALHSPTKRRAETTGRKVADLCRSGQTHMQDMSHDGHTSHPGSAPPFPRHQAHLSSLRGRISLLGCPCGGGGVGVLLSELLSLPLPQQCVFSSPYEHQPTSLLLMSQCLGRRAQDSYPTTSSPFPEVI